MSDMEGGEIYKLVEHISGTRTEDEHFHAVQAQCQFVSQIYLGLLHMSAQGNGLAAESLLRTTFESAVNCIILAKHKAKLPDFIRYGQFTDLRLLRFNTLPSPIKERVDRLIQATDPDWTPLCNEFKGSTKWHKMQTKDSFVEAEYPPEIYDKYYRRASTISHGEPYVVVRNADDTWKKWTVEARPAHWKNQTIGTYIFGSLAVLHMLT